MNAPLLLTFFRIALSPVFPLLYLGYDALGIPLKLLPFLLLFFLLLSESTDILDGYLARRLGLVTELGKLLDPMADTIAKICLFLSFTQGFLQIPLYLVLIFLYRDLLVTTLRTFCAVRGYALAARTSGKIKTVLQGVVSIAILALMIPYAWDLLSLATLRAVSISLMSIASAYSVFSAVDYFYANRHFLRN
jgi:CDP-diacylglycerol--glycerol-3-phosphate 3-phosphatidyltransferase